MMVPARGASACGDNVVPVGVPLAHSDVLFLAAHEDDEMLFMQPELLSRIADGSSMTYVGIAARPRRS